MFNKFQLDTPEAKQLRDDPLDSCAAVILLKLMCHMGNHNIVKGKPITLVRKFNVTMWDFSHGVRKLKHLGYVRKFGKWEYMVNPNLIYNGDDARFYIVKHMWEEQTVMGVRNA